MSQLAETDRLFFERAGLDRDKTQRLVEDALAGAEDGELFLEYRLSEAISFDDGRVKSASYDAAQGFGLRAISGEAQGYAHASELSEGALKRAAETVKAVRHGRSGAMAEPPIGTNRRLYEPINPLADPGFERKVALLAEIDAYARSRDPRVRQVMA